MKKFEVGELIDVANSKGEPTRRLRFIGISEATNKYICEDQVGLITSWVDAWEVDEEAGYRPYTKKTFPKGVAWVREKGSDKEELVLAITSDYVSLARGAFTYEQLLEGYEINLNRIGDWKVVGVKL